MTDLRECPMTASDLRADLKRRIAALGTQREAARAFGISPASLSMLLTGRRPLTEKQAAKLGYVTVYQPKGEQ